MKSTFLALGLLIALNSHADIEFSADKSAKATATEVEQSRSCFKELEVQGCGGPGDDQKQFRSCLNNVHPSLSENCQKMMSELYGNK